MSPRAKSPLDLEYALLGLVRAGPLHAYELHQRLGETEVLNLIWRLPQRQVYALLERLEDEGYLAGTTEVQGHRPPRRMLQITAAGREVFEQWLATPVQHGRDFRQQFMAKLLFARQAGDARLEGLITAQEAVFQQQILDFTRQLAATPAARELDTLVIQFRIRQLETCLGWLATCRAALLIQASVPHP